MLLRLHLLLSNGYFRSYPRFDIRFLEGSKSIYTQAYSKKKKESTCSTILLDIIIRYALKLNIQF